MTGESTVRWPSAGFALLAAWWCALALSGIHLLSIAFRYRVLHQLVWHSREIVWMAPAGYLLLFTAAAVPLAALAFIAPARVSRRFIVGALSALGIFGALLLVPRIHPVASLALAAGIGIRLGSLPERIWHRRAWSLAGGTLGLAIAVVAGGHVVAQRSAVRRERSAPLPPSENTPNVLLLVWDDVGAPNVSLYGHARPTTPALDRWAKDGVVFDWAFATASWTLPSHASIMTGVAAGDQTGDWRTPLDSRQRTLAEQFAARGFATAGFVANLVYTHSFSGLSRGFVTYDEHRRSLIQVLFSTTFLQMRAVRHLLREYSPPAIAKALRHVTLRLEQPYWAYDQKLDGSVSDAFLRWQRGIGRRPFFVFINYYNAHQFSAPDDFISPFPRDTTREPAYDRAINYLDSEVQRVLDSLKVREQLDNTLVVLTSDHGEMMGEHGLWDHEQGLYLPALHVPLVMRYPRTLPTGLRVDHPVSLRDLARTIVSIASPSDSAAFPGRSIMEHLRPSPADTMHTAMAEVSKGINAEPNWPIAKGNMTSFVDAEYQYIHNGDGAEELYAYREDSLEVNNLATTPKGRDIVQRFRERLQRVREARAGSAASRPAGRK